MREVIMVVVLLGFFSGWIMIEIFTRSGIRIAVGIFIMMGMTAAWVQANIRAERCEGIHAACFLEIESLLISGKVDDVEKAVAVYNSSSDEFRAHDAYSVLCSD